MKTSEEAKHIADIIQMIYNDTTATSKKIDAGARSLSTRKMPLGIRIIFLSI